MCVYEHMPSLVFLYSEIIRTHTFFKKICFLFICKCACPIRLNSHVCVHSYCMCVDTCRGQKRASDHTELKLTGSCEWLYLGVGS